MIWYAIQYKYPLDIPVLDVTDNEDHSIVYKTRNKMAAIKKFNEYYKNIGGFQLVKITKVEE